MVIVFYKTHSVYVMSAQQKLENKDVLILTYCTSYCTALTFSWVSLWKDTIPSKKCENILSYVFYLPYKMFGTSLQVRKNLYKGCYRSVLIISHDFGNICRNENKNHILIFKNFNIFFFLYTKVKKMSGTKLQ